MFDGVGVQSGMLGLSYWSDAAQTGVPNVFGASKVAVPQGAEYFAVSWLALPATVYETGPFPEDLFRIIWGLGV